MALWGNSFAASSVGANRYPSAARVTRRVRAILSGEVRDGDTVTVDVTADGTTLTLASAG